MEVFSQGNQTHRWAWDKFSRETGVMHGGISNTEPHSMIACDRSDLVSQSDQDHIEGCGTCRALVMYLRDNN